MNLLYLAMLHAIRQKFIKLYPVVCITIGFPILLCGCSSSQSASVPGAPSLLWSIGYWTPWGTPALPVSAIQWDGLTHVVHWGALVNPDGSLDLISQQVEQNAPALVTAAHTANVKVLLGIGQAYWLGQTTYFQLAATNSRTTLVTNILNFVNAYGYDGVDIDWEPFTGEANGIAMRGLIADLRRQLGRKILTAAAMITSHEYWGAISSYLDRINIMTYDMSHTSDSRSWHNSALYGEGSPVRFWTVNLAVRRYLKGGVPPGKLGIGIPFYGWQWSGGSISMPAQSWTHKPYFKQVAFNSFYHQINSKTYRWDVTAQVPYLSSSDGANGFLTFDDAKSIAAKIEYVKTHGLGGWIIWALDQDFFPDSNPHHPLMNAVRDAMLGSVQETRSE